METASAAEPPGTEIQTQPTTNTMPLTPFNSSPNRLGMRFDQRLLLTGFTSFWCGFALGSTSAGHMASLRFRAENAHRLPTTRPGWYLYHKSKNYYKTKHGVIEGVRKGCWVAAWTGVFFIIEESLDVFRGTWRAGRTLKEMEGVDELDLPSIDSGVETSRDFVSTTMAGMVTGGIWSAWNQFPMATAARTIRMGLIVGLGYGLAQDALTWARGRNVGYIDEAESWIYKGAKNREKQQEETNNKSE